MSYERFVQIECGLPDSKLIDRALDALDTDAATVVGSFVLLWIAALGLRNGGDLSERSDRWIEEAARWRGSRGAFARFVREQHLDEHGCIRDFDAKYGKLDIERRKATRIKRLQRERAKQGPEQAPDSPADVDRTSTGQTEDCPRIPSISLSVSPDVDLEQGKGEREREGESPVEFVEARFGAHAAPITALVRGARNPMAVAATIVAHLDGLHGPVYTPEVIALAATEYAATDEATFKPRLFAGFVRRAEGTVKLTDSRKQQQSETRYIAAVVEEGRRVDDDIASDERVIAEYEATHGELEVQLIRSLAETKVPKKWGNFRPAMVQAELAKLVRERSGENNGGGEHAAR